MCLEEIYSKPTTKQVLQTSNKNLFAQSQVEQDQISPFEDAPLSVNAIPETEIDKAPLLVLQIIEGNDIGWKFKINACGLAGGQGRCRRDGCVLVGSQEFSDMRGKDQNDNNEPYNDIVLDQDSNADIGKRHFLIKYNRETISYYLRDLGDGNGTFVRLDNPLQLKTGYIISFGDSHMFIQITDDLNESFSKLEIKFLDGPIA